MWKGLCYLIGHNNIFSAKIIQISHLSFVSWFLAVLFRIKNIEGREGLATVTI